MRIATESPRELEIDSDAYTHSGWNAPWINFAVSDDGSLVIANQGDAEAVFSPEETPDVLLAIQAWIERLT